MKPVLLIAIALTLATAATALYAQSSYPSRPIRLVVPYPPGGGADVVGRALAEKLSARLGQQVIIDNRGGAATAIGAEIVSRANPDGYTILLATVTTLAVNPNLQEKIPYDPVRSFEPISMVSAQPQLLVVPPSLNITNLKDLIALAKSKPGSLNFGSPGIGSGGHLAGELMNSMANIKTVHVGYKGAGPAVVDLLGGRVSFMFATISTVNAHVQARRLIGLAVSTSKRSPALPAIPTMAEAGILGFSMRSWNGLVAPVKTPQSVINKLGKETVAALSQPDFERQLEQLGFDPSPSTANEFATFIKTELELHLKIMQAAGLK